MSSRVYSGEFNCEGAHKLTWVTAVLSLVLHASSRREGLVGGSEGLSTEADRRDVRWMMSSSGCRAETAPGCTRAAASARRTENPLGHRRCCANCGRRGDLGPRVSESCSNLAHRWQTSDRNAHAHAARAEAHVPRLGAGRYGPCRSGHLYAYVTLTDRGFAPPLPTGSVSGCVISALLAEMVNAEWGFLRGRIIVRWCALRQRTQLPEPPTPPADGSWGPLTARFREDEEAWRRGSSGASEKAWPFP